MNDYKDDIVPEEEVWLSEEPEADIQPETDAGTKPEPSETDLLQQKYDELNDRYLRLMAEYDNFRKRTQREKEGLYADATAMAVEKFLPTMDSFDRACSFEQDSEEFRKGFDLIHTNFRGVLEALGVEAFGEVGDPFDPTIHNAVYHIEDESLGENIISQVLQKGYKLGGRIIRYAMVQTAN